MISSSEEVKLSNSFTKHSAAVLWSWLIRHTQKEREKERWRRAWLNGGSMELVNQAHTKGERKGKREEDVHD